MKGATAIFDFADKGSLTFRTYDTNSDRCLLPVAFLSKAVDKRKEDVFNVDADNNTNLTTAMKEFLG